MNNYKNLGALLQTGLAGLAAAFAGGAMAIGASQYMPREYQCIESQADQQPVPVAPAQRQWVPGLLV